MRTGERIAKLRVEKGWSQSHLARLSGVAQSTIGKLEAGISSGSSHLHKIARALDTTPAYLAGEIDDSNAGAPPPASSPRAQHVMLPVALPHEEGLYRAYLGLLMASRHMDEDALARELAKRLPTMLGVLKGPLTIDYDGEAAAVPPTADPEQRRA